MRRSGDSRVEMTKILSLDDETLDRLLSGRIDPADAPPEWSGVAGLVREMVAPPTAPELAGMGAAVAAASALLTMPPMPILDAGSARSASRRAGPDSSAQRWHRSSSREPWSARPGLAAAGVLPDSVQGFAHRVLEKVGIQVPEPTNGGPGDGVDRPAGPGAGPNDPAADPGPSHRAGAAGAVLHQDASSNGARAWHRAGR